MTLPVVISEVLEVVTVAEGNNQVTVQELGSPVQVEEFPETPVMVTEEVGSPLEVSEGSPISVQVSQELLAVAELAVGVQGPPGEEGLRWCGIYHSDRDYKPHDLVRDGASLFICLTSSRDVATTNGDYWEIFLPTGGDVSYRHQQIPPASIWVISHNLGKFPAVTVVDSAGSAVEGLVEYVDLNQLHVIFSSPFAGDAFLN